MSNLDEQDILDVCEKALLTWLHTFSYPECDPFDAARAWHHLEEHGGTCAYVADVLERIRLERVVMSDGPKEPLRTADGGYYVYVPPPVSVLLVECGPEDVDPGE